MILAVLVAPVITRAQTTEQAPAMQTIAAARLSALAEKAVHALVNDPDHSVRADYRFTDQLVPAGKVTIQAQSAQANPTYIAIPLLISVDAKPIRTIYAGYRVITYIKTAIAAHTLGAGTVLTADDLANGRVESTGRKPVEVASLVGRKLSVAAAMGSPIYFEQTRQNEIVVAGQPAVYILHDGPVVISADVVARTSGAMGQVVAVYNPNTRKDLSGVVTGPGKVEYTLPGEDQ
jgi:flagella basal body P-ring formation protein FlgA